MLNIEPIPAFKDNYIWLITEKDDNRAFVVDPGDPEVVLKLLKNRQLELSGILITHHHMDHTGGIDALLTTYQVPVYGPNQTPCTSISHPLTEKQTIQVLSEEFTILEVPGHTMDHIAYFCNHNSSDLISTDLISTDLISSNREPSKQNESPILFCGDTLFAAGCGRLFEGTAEIMWDSLQKLSSLPANTRVYCTHEYTLANLKFANAVEPDNSDLQQRTQRESAKRNQAQPTLPSTIALENRTNPFLRCHLPSVIEPVESYTGRTLTSPVEVFGKLRKWKDQF